MATYYVSPDGSDANNGLGPDASHATNKPWLTLGKVFATGSTVVPGDIVWFAPGIYYTSATVVAIAAITSSASPTAFRGDSLNVQGFKTAAGVRRAPGRVEFTQRTTGETDDAPAGAAVCLTLSTNSIQGAQFYNICVEAGNGGSAVRLSIATSKDILFEDCRLCGALNGVDTSGGVPTAGRNWTFRRSILAGGNLSVRLNSAVAAATADADLNVNLEHCLYLGGMSLNIGTVAGNKAGGVHLRGGTIIAPASAGINTVGGGHSIVTTSTYEGCLFVACSQMAFAGDAGALVDSGYNRSLGEASDNNNVTYAGTTKRRVPWHIVLPDLMKWGLSLPRSDWFGWDDDAVAAQYDSGWTNTDPDFRNRTPRPWGAGPSIGYIEKIPISKDTGSVITGGGANSLKLTGAGEHSLLVPVDAVPTTITISTESSGYGGSNYPQLIMEANPEIGVTQQIASAVSVAEQTLTIGPFTPTAAGVVELRLVSRSTSGTSATYFDLLAAAV